MMKQLIVASFFLTGGMFAQAQDLSLDSLRPKAKERQFAFALNRESGFFAFKKYCSPTMAMRYGLGGSYLFNKTESREHAIGYTSTPTIAYVESKNKNVEATLFFTVGFQRSFGNFKRFEPYTGIDFYLGNSFVKNTSERYYSHPLPIGYPVITNTERINNLNARFGILPLIGFNYYVADRFALGAEYRLSLFNLTFQGKSENTVRYKFEDGHYETGKYDSNKNLSANGNFSGTAYVTATLFLGNR